MYVYDFGVRNFKLNHKMKDGWSALMYACINNFSLVVNFLLEHGADINTTDRLFRNPMHWVCRYQNIKIANILLNDEYKLNLEQTDMDMMIPIDIARHYHNYEMEKLLIVHE